MIVIKIETENAAFGEGDIEMLQEVGNILLGLSRCCRDGIAPRAVLDANGNTVGTVEYREGE